MGDVLTVEQARAAGLGASYPDTLEGNAALDERIVAQEKWLASRVGPLLGPLTDERINSNGGVRLWLRRPAVVDSLEVTLSGEAVDAADVFVTHTRELTRVDEDRWYGRIVATYEPDDEEVIREALIALLRLALTESGMQSETISGSSYSYTRGDGKGGMLSRDAIVASILRPGAGLGY